MMVDENGRGQLLQSFSSRKLAIRDLDLPQVNCENCFEVQSVMNSDEHAPDCTYLLR